MSPYRRQVPPATSEALLRLRAALATWRERTEAATADLARTIGDCLQAGATWGEVGRQLGMTKQGARAHWLPYLDRSRDKRPGCDGRAGEEPP